MTLLCDVFILLLLLVFSHYSIMLLLLGRVALGAQWDIVIKLSRGRSVGLSSALWKNGGSNPAAVLHHMSNG